MCIQGWSQAEGQDESVAGAGPRPLPSRETTLDKTYTEGGEITTFPDKGRITLYLNLGK